MIYVTRIYICRHKRALRKVINGTYIFFIKKDIRGFRGLIREAVANWMTCFLKSCYCYALLSVLFSFQFTLEIWTTISWQRQHIAKLHWEMARNNSFTCAEIGNLIVISHTTAKPRQCPIRIIERALTDFRSRLPSSDRRGDGDTIVERRPEVQIKR